MEPFIDKVTAAEAKKLDAALARMIYATGIPLSTVNHPAFVDFVKLLRPSYAVPSRDRLSGELLDEEYLAVRQAIEKKIESAESVTVMSDGW
jgi:hypothetical protein